MKRISTFGPKCGCPGWGGWDRLSQTSPIPRSLDGDNKTFLASYFLFKVLMIDFCSRILVSTKMENYGISLTREVSEEIKKIKKI